MNSREKARELAKSVIEGINETRKELVEKMISKNKHPDDWVIVDNADEYIKSLSTDNPIEYQCNIKFLLKKDR